MAVHYQQGLYHVEGLDHAFQSTKTTGKPMIVLRVKVLGIVDETTPDREVISVPQYERTIRMVIDDDEESREYLMKRLRHAGWQGTRFEDFRLEGQIMEARCVHKAQKSSDPKYDGQLGEEWGLPLPPKKSDPLVSDNSLAKKMNALFAKQLKAVRKPEDGPAKKLAAPQRSESDPHQPPVDHVSSYFPPDDEVPF